VDDLELAIKIINGGFLFMQAEASKETLKRMAMEDRQVNKKPKRRSSNASTEILDDLLDNFSRT
jgi:hypothetical protein